MAANTFVSFVLDQLAELPGGVRARAMFGGHGLYCGSHFFGVLASDRVYFKTDQQTRTVYAERGMSYLRFSETAALKNYWEVPLEVLENARRAVEWATIAVQLAEASPRVKRPKKSPAASKPARQGSKSARRRK